ncbi:hypothetical protein BH09PLA1_BH09PLA1_18740 [soil metagenome]
MSWEAFRLTSKSPSELYTVMGPAGVDSLVRHALQECWTSIPETDRTYTAWKRRADKTFARNRRVWSAIKKPTPAAFFDNLAPYPSDGHLRQAMVMCWMMMPRAGGRDFKFVVKAMDQIFQRNLDAWETDNRTFTHSPTRRKSVQKKTRKMRATKKTVKSTKKKSRR